MKIRFFFPTIILFSVGLLCFCSTKTFADKITPSIYQQSLISGTTSTGKVTFSNESNEPVVISPKVSAYDPSTEQLVSEESNLFVIIDKETYTVQPKTTLALNYQINPPKNLTPGTYFNIIILQQDTSSTYLSEKNQSGATQILSQLVALNIFSNTDNNTKLEISGDFAQINMEIIDAGIPFIKPLKIKYTYQNTTNYVLQPAGEIQSFDSKSSYSPVYIKINNDGTKLYPGQTKEETVTIDQWHISDIIYGRKIVGRFYNSIDQNLQTKELTQNTYFLYIGVIAVVILIVIILIKSIQKDKQK